MKTTTVLWSVALVCLSLGATSNAVTLVSYLGSDVTTNGAWESTDVAKTAAFDPNGNNAYGSNGNYLYYNQVVESVNTELLSNVMPSYATVSQIAGNNKYSNPVYAAFDDPAVGPGVNVYDAHVGFFYNWAYGTAQVNLLNVTLSSNADFVLGVIAGGSTMTPDGLRVLQTVGGAAEASADSSGTPKQTGGALGYYFFHISGVAGDQFVVSGLGTDRDVGITGVTLESSAVIPEPSTLMCGLAGLLAYAWRRRK